MGSNNIIINLINDPVVPSSMRISNLREDPSIADQAPKIKYNVPISLWFVENNHFFIFMYI